MRQETMAFIGQIKSARLPLEQFHPRKCFHFTHRLVTTEGEIPIMEAAALLFPLSATAMK